jgi:hypothetical protein
LGTGSFGEFFIVILQIQKYGFPPVNTKKLYNFSMQTRRGLGKHLTNFLTLKKTGTHNVNIIYIKSNTDEILQNNLCDFHKCLCILCTPRTFTCTVFDIRSGSTFYAICISYVSTEPEFLNICWMLKSLLLKKSLLVKVQRVQQGSDREQLLSADGIDLLCKLNKRKSYDKMTQHLYFIWKILANLLGNLAFTLSAQLSFQSV